MFFLFFIFCINVLLFFFFFFFFNDTATTEIYTLSLHDALPISAQACVVTALSHAPAFVDLLGLEPTRAGAFITGRSIKGARYRVFWPCRDGYINFIFYGGVAGRRTNAQLVAWMRERGAELGVLADIDWKSWDPTKADQ